MHKILVFLLFGFYSCVTVEDASRRVTAATRVFSVLVEKDIVTSLQENQVLYFSSNYDGVKFEKDQVALIGYINTKGQDTMKAVPIRLSDTYKSFSIKKRFGNYYLTRQMVDSIQNEIANEKNQYTHFLLEPVASTFENYVSYTIKPVTIGELSSFGASKIVARLDPSPPAAAFAAAF